MDYKPIYISNLIEDVKKIQQFKAKVRNIDFICEIDDQLKEKEFTTDPRRLKRIMLNLVDNAMKFTTEGYIKIKSSLKKIQDKEAIEIKIIDTGLGIKKEDQKKLFKLFSTLDEKEITNSSGTGIGLYQSNESAKKLGFSNSQGIILKSEWKKGSIFSFILEDKRMEIQETEVMIQNNDDFFDEFKEKIEIPNLQKNFFISQNQLKKLKDKRCCPRILVVDDNECNIHALRLLLEVDGYDSDFALNGKLAVNMVLKQEQKECNCKYSLILLDCNMPVMNGYDACKSIKNMGQEKIISEIFIVAQTADATQANHLKCVQFGFDGVITKPIDNGELLGVLNKYLKN